MTTFLKAYNLFQPLKNFLQPQLEVLTVPKRGRKYKVATPKKRFPPWFIKQDRVQHEENLTKDNKEFIQEVIRNKYPQPDIYGNPSSPLNLKVIEPNTEWKPGYQRTGVIAKKLGIVPMWCKDGRKVLTTMLQVLDNHVIQYIPPEKYNAVITKRLDPRPATKGCIIVGADSCDPQKFTKAYCGLFNESGVMPKRLLARFFVSPEAALQPGTPLYATHFQPGSFVDVRGKTIDRGFQGVMKRWGFHGMPASHGVTKTHRRPGNIGSGGTKSRVMPGTKMPGHMGNRYRIVRGLRILRVNRKFNVIWVLGQATAGETNSFVRIYDTRLVLKSHKALNTVPPFPTYFPGENDDENLPEEVLVDDLHNFSEPTIMYKVEE